MAEVVDEIVLSRPSERTPVDDFTIVKDNEEYVVEGAGLERLMRRLDLNNEEAIAYLQNLFEKIGLNKALAELGFQKRHYRQG